MQRSYRAAAISAGRARRLQVLSVRADLAQDPLQARLAGGVHVTHRARDPGMHGGDLLVHRVGHRTVGGMTLPAGAQLADVHRLPGVEIEGVADPVPEAERVRRGVRDPWGLGPSDPPPRQPERALVLAPYSGLADLLGDPGAEVGGEPLPLAGQQAVALQVAEATVVGDDLEPVADRLPPPPGPVAAVAPLAGKLGEHQLALAGVESLDARPDLGLGESRPLEQRGGEEVLLSTVDVHEVHLRSLAGLAAVQPQPGDPALGRIAALAQVPDPLAAPVGALDPGQKAGNDLVQLLEHQAGEVTGLGKRGGHQPQEELLVRLARGEDPDVAERRGGQQPTQKVECLGLDRTPPRGLGLLAAGPLLGRPRLHGLEAARVDPEQLVHRRAVGLAELLAGVVAVAPVREGPVVGDVARGLLQVGGEAPALQLLGENVRDPLAGEVGATHLGDRVVAIADEHALVETGGALSLLSLEGAPALRDIGGELVEEEPSQRPGVAGVAREHRPLHRFGEVDEREHGPLEVREVRGKERSLLVGEGLGRVAHGSPILASGPARSIPPAWDSAYPAGGGGAAINSIRPPPGMSANARDSSHSSRVSSTSNPVSRSRATAASKSEATTPACPSGGAVASGVWIRWICVPSRSSQVRKGAIGSGAGTRAKPSSANSSIVRSTSFGVTSSET